jgi:uncharacterized membrane protein
MFNRKSITDGLKLTIPLLVTISILVWVLITIESACKTAILWFIPIEWYFPGSGALFGIVALFVTSILLQSWILRLVHDRFAALLMRLPLVRILYEALTSLVGFIAGSGPTAAGQPVVVNIGGNRLLGIITRDHANDLDPALKEQDLVAVYLPMSYQIGGHTILIPSDQITELNMTTDKALKVILTACLRKDSD